MRKAVLLLLLALATGVAWAFEFSREGHLLSPWVALAPGLLLLGTRRPVLSSFLWGIGFWTAGVYWILDTLVTYGQLEGWLGGLALLILAAILGGYQALFAWPGARLWRRAAEGDLLSGLVGLPALWLICEWLRGHLFSGFPWNLAGYAWVEVPGALELSAWIGAYGLSALVVAANAGVALAARRRSLLPLALGWMVPLLLLALGGRFAHPPELPDSLPAPVRIVQPNIPNLVTWDTAVAARNYSRLLDLSREACDRQGALVIWPESAGWPYSYPRDPELRADVDSLVAAGCPLLFNSATQNEAEQWFNSGFLLAPGEAPARADKLHLVPYGEYVPLASLLPFVGRIARNAGDFHAAQRPVLLPWGGEKIGLAICYEGIFPEEVAERVRGGASLLAVVTNDAWYGDTTAPWQHLRAARFRAAESHRMLLRAAITGVSAVIGPDGRVGEQLGVGAQGIIRGVVAGSQELTPYSRRPWLTPLTAFLITAFCLARLWLVRTEP